jgi:hypothetical protein
MKRMSLFARGGQANAGLSHLHETHVVPSSSSTAPRRQKAARRPHRGQTNRRAQDRSVVQPRDGRR